jgi:hypothetical protein
MARQDAGTMFRSLPTTQTLGDYNGVSRVGPSTTFHATGSRAGAGFIIENVTNVLIHCASGGSLNGDQCTVKVLYPIGVKKVVNGSSGIVHVLHR